MAHFDRMMKNDLSAVRKAGDFQPADSGGKDAGWSKQPGAGVTSSPVGHLHNVADQHAREGDLHAQISENLRNVGMDKQGAGHKQIATEHDLASAHYRAAANAVSNARDMSGNPDSDPSKHLEAAQPHLKAARQCAQDASGYTDKMKG